jgi:hypothetical protein
VEDVGLAHAIEMKHTVAVQEATSEGHGQDMENNLQPQQHQTGSLAALYLRRSNVDKWSTNLISVRFIVRGGDVIVDTNALRHLVQA